jgi:hypothetical protein
VCLDALVDDSLELLGPRLKRQSITVEREEADGDTMVLADEGGRPGLSGIGLHLDQR